MRRNNNKALYEQITRKIYKQATQHLNEDSMQIDNTTDKLLNLYYDLQKLLNDPHEYTLTSVFYGLSKDLLGFSDNNKLALIEKVSGKLDDYEYNYKLKLKANIISFLFEYTSLNDEEQDLHNEKVMKRNGYWIEAQYIQKDVYSPQKNIYVYFYKTNDPDYDWITDPDDGDIEYLEGLDLDSIYSVFTETLIDHNMITEEELSLIYKMMEDKH